MNETNWASEIKKTISDKDMIALEKAHKRERKLIKNGYRWYELNGRTQILVECDENGHPTELGRRQIEKIRECL